MAKVAADPGVAEDLAEDFVQERVAVAAPPKSSPDLEEAWDFASASHTDSADPGPEASPPPDPAPEPPLLQRETLDLAARDVRMVLQEQNSQNQMLTTKLNILFVSNGALLTSLSISRLLVSGSPFSLAEAFGFLLSFTLLMRAFLPRQVAVTPNLEDRKFLETYLALSYDDYQLQMLVNLAETYNANRQRLEDVSQSLKYAAYTTWVTAAIMLVHTLMTYFQVSQ
jgi:hypothetical protein